MKGNENPKHFAIDLVSFLDAKRQTEYYLLRGRAEYELTAGELWSYFV